MEEAKTFTTSTEGASSAGATSLQRFHGRLSALVPPGWLAAEVIHLKSPTGGSRLVVASEPVGQSMDAAQFARNRGEALARSSDTYRELEFTAAEMFDGRQGYLRRYELTGPGTSPMTHIELYCVEGGRAYVATAMMPVSESDSPEWDMRRILAGLRIEPE